MDIFTGHGNLLKFANYTRVVAVLDVVLATLGFFFNPFNDEVNDVPFLYWKIIVTCFIFEIWMIVSIHLFVATQKLETQQNPKKSIKYCNFWLVVASLAFIVFEAIIVFPQTYQPTSLAQLYWPSGILLYRIIATLIVLNYKDKLTKYSFSVSGELERKLHEAYPDLLHASMNPSMDFHHRNLCLCKTALNNTLHKNSNAAGKLRPEINFYLNPHPVVQEDSSSSSSNNSSSSSNESQHGNSNSQSVDLLTSSSATNGGFHNDLLRGVNV